MKENSQSNEEKGLNLKFIKNEGYLLPVAIVLLFVFSLVIGYYVNSRAEPEGYTTIYLLDAQKNAIDYPELLVTNQNSTFKAWLGVVNHMNTTRSFRILEKITEDKILPIGVEVDVKNRYELKLEKGEVWETEVEVSFNESGSFSLIFELWIYNDSSDPEFSFNYCVLHLDVVDQS